MKKAAIKVGFCVAYDWYMLQHSLPLVYEAADVICLSVDKNRKSWTGTAYAFDEQAFRQLVEELDTKDKIKIYEDDFHISSLSPMQNEVRQRNLMAAFMGMEGWHIQLDADEYILDFAKFVHYLKTNSFNRPVNICCPFYILYKQTDEGYLLIQHSGPALMEFIPIATNKPHYEFGRRNGYFNVKTELGVVHQSWARNDKEILEKINNWGHKEDFDVMAYFKKWQQLHTDNYKDLLNFHPIEPRNWEKLVLIKAASIADLINQLKAKPVFTIPASYLRKENSIWLSRGKALWKKINKS